MTNPIRPPLISQSKPGIAFFGHDRHEPTIVKRVTAFLDAGWPVYGFMFERQRQSVPRVSAPCATVALGVTVDRHYLRRLSALALGLLRALRHGADLRAASVVYARNLDMALMAWLTTRLVGAQTPLVYEVLDIQRLVLGTGLSGRLARAIERFILRRCSLLVVSSPDFLTRYFEPVQAYRGASFLLENKVSASQTGGRLANPPRRVQPKLPWVIGWFGTLRCSKSLEQLTRIADALGDNVRIEIRGRLSHEDIDPEAFNRTLAERSNMLFGGPYGNPGQLADIYGSVHFSWSVDYLDAGTNSDWLLPNRLYEGGLNGAVALARANTATGRYVVNHALGWTLPEPLDRSVIALLTTLDWLEFAMRRDAIIDRNVKEFVDLDDTLLLLQRMTAPRQEVAFTGATLVPPGT